MSALTSPFSDLFHIWSGLWRAAPRGRRPMTIPPLNVTEDALGITLELVVPNLHMDDIKVSYLERYNQLGFSCNCDTKGYLSRKRLKEFDFSRFMRMYYLGRRIDFSQMRKILENGVLTVSIPWGD